MISEPSEYVCTRLRFQLHLSPINIVRCCIIVRALQTGRLAHSVELQLSLGSQSGSWLHSSNYKAGFSTTPSMLQDTLQNHYWHSDTPDHYVAARPDRHRWCWPGWARASLGSTIPTYPMHSIRADSSNRSFCGSDHALAQLTSDPRLLGCL